MRQWTDLRPRAAKAVRAAKAAKAAKVPRRLARVAPVGRQARVEVVGVVPVALVALVALVAPVARNRALVVLKLAAAAQKLEVVGRVLAPVARAEVGVHAPALVVKVEPVDLALAAVHRRPEPVAHARARAVRVAAGVRAE